MFVVSLCRRYNVPIFLKTGLEIHIQTWGRGGVVGRGLGGGTVPADYVKPLRIFGEILGNGNVLDIGHLREISKLCWGPEKTKVFLIYAYGLGLAGIESTAMWNSSVEHLRNDILHQNTNLSPF